MLTAYVCGVPVDARSVIVEALNRYYNEGVVGIEELDKNMLKTKIRLSYRNPSVVLVVLDGECTDICRGCENGLYSSDKFYSYSNMKGLISFLNTKYDLDLPIPVEEEELSLDSVASDEDDYKKYSEEYVESLEAQLAHEKFISKNLKVRVADLSSMIEKGVAVGIKNDDSESKEENEGLRSEILTLKNIIAELNSEINELRTSVSTSSEDVDRYKKEYESAVEEYDRVVGEFSSCKAENEELRKSISDLKEKLDACEEDLAAIRVELSKRDENIQSLSATISEKDMEISRIKVDLAQKDREILRYSKELNELRKNQISSSEIDKREKTIAMLKEELNDLSTENSSLQKEVSYRESVITDKDADIDRVLEESKEKDDEIQRLRKRSEEDSLTIEALNKKMLEVKSKVEIERLSASGDLTEAYVQVKRELARVRSGVFGQLESLSMPESPVRVSLAPGLTGGKAKLNNVRFVFAGSSESRKGSYRCLLNDLRGANPKVDYLVVDLVSETSIDYVFEMPRVISGVDWFRKGGNLQQYVSKTVLRNVSVLSPGLRYINDSYFLSVDWDKRLRELEESGYQVMVFCGDLSNVVSRVLHESFAGLGLSVIYVHGNAVGTRALVTNLRGITNGSESIVGYFDFNKNFEKFYNIVAKTNRCRVISYSNI